MHRWLNIAILIIATAIGLVAFLSPFLTGSPGDASTAGGFAPIAHVGDAPLLLVVLVVICLGTVLANMMAGSMDAKVVAILGVLVAVSAVLRFLPGPGGFSGIFFLPILAGYVYGASFGFLLGSLSLLVSALLGGGVGPWLPYQMFAAGWMGLLAAALPDLRRHRWLEVVSLTVWSFALGLLFGAIMNLWFWPFVFRPASAEMYWQPGQGIGEAARRYLAFYLVTSLSWDLWRAAGNALLMALLARPVLQALRRFQERFRFEWVPVPEESEPGITKRPVPQTALSRSKAA
ncbi:MAG TPA: ECF transporter S component [Anaerolineae bacterium]|nr:ECF transporter S component [Anaerolineae bacterium]HIQ05327.1 ECF transporter S component [Anaerolineae bacterium]